VFVDKNRWNHREGLGISIVSYFKYFRHSPKRVLGTFSEAVYGAVYKRGQLARRSSAHVGAGKPVVTIPCASTNGSAPSADLSALAPHP